MRILHLMLACFYIDNYNYQENILPRIHKEAGHDVKIVASTESFIDNARIGYIDPGRYINENGIEVVRLPYKKNVTQFVSVKARAYVGLYEEIEAFKPEVIMCHGMQFKDLDLVGKYKRLHPEVKVFVDCHEDEHNSATSFLSKYGLHKMFYVPILKRNLRHIEKVLCVATTSMDFMRDFYKVPEEYLEHYPLGGIVDPDDRYTELRKKYRADLNAGDGETIVLHSGKMDAGKKTKELINAFSAVKNDNIRLVIIGSIPEEENHLYGLIEADERIDYLGWKSGEDLMGYLCASDMYAQPGTQSATLQNAACARNALMMQPYSSYVDLFEDKALFVNDQAEIEKVFRDIAADDSFLNNVKSSCFELAKQKLDYNKLAERVIPSAETE